MPQETTEKRMTCYADPAFAETFKAHCKRQRRSVSEQMLIALEEHLERSQVQRDARTARRPEMAAG